MQLQSVCKENKRQPQLKVQFFLVHRTGLLNTNSIHTWNLIPSCQHPGHIPLEYFSGKRQSVAHLHVFGAKCWAKTPTAHGDSKLDPHSTECQLLGYASSSGNYKVQDITSLWVYVLCRSMHSGILQSTSSHLIIVISYLILILSISPLYMFGSSRIDVCL